MDLGRAKRAGLKNCPVKLNVSGVTMSSTNKPRRYYLDANILLLLDEYCLVGKLEEYGRQTQSGLHTSTTVKNELTGENRKTHSRHNMPTAIASSIDRGTIKVNNSITSNDYEWGKINAQLLRLNDGEISLIRLIMSDQKSNPSVQPLLVTNDKDAITDAEKLGVKSQSIANILARMSTNNLVECDTAIQITLKSLSKKAFHLLTV